MSSIIDTLITDRTQNDVDRLKDLKEKMLKNGGISALTVEEQAEYFNSVVKGSYNYTDLNRVSDACAYIYNLLIQSGYIISNYQTLKNDWVLTDIPTLTEMNKYTTTLTALKQTLSASQQIPDTMRFLNFSNANNIEKLLVELNDIYDLLLKSMFYSNEVYCGEV